MTATLPVGVCIGLLTMCVSESALAQDKLLLDKRMILEEFAAFLAIPNVADDAPNIRRNAEALEVMMQKRGLSPGLLVSSKAPDAPPIVYGESKVPKARRTIVIYAHYDGQPVNAGEWTNAPWTPTLRTGPISEGGDVLVLSSPAALSPDTRIYARGAADDKGGVFAILGAIDALRAANKQPTDNLKIVFEGEEEADSPHLSDILEEHSSLLKSDLWIICDGAVHPSGRTLVTYGARGGMVVNVTVYGAIRPLHSGHYGNWAPNPALRLARLLTSMKDDQGHVTIAHWYDGIVPMGTTERKAIASAAEFDATLQRELEIAAPESTLSLAESTTLPSLNISGIRSADVGAQAANVIPDKAVAVLDLRLVEGILPQQQYERLIAHVRGQGYFVIDHEPTKEERLAHPLIATMFPRPGRYAAARVSMDDPFAHSIVAAVRKASVEPVMELPTSGGTVPVALIKQILGAPFIGIGIANYDNNQHAADENLRLGNLWKGIELYSAILTHPAPR